MQRRGGCLTRAMRHCWSRHGGVAETRGDRDAGDFQRVRNRHAMDVTYEPQITLRKLRSRAPLLASLGIAIVAIAWLASAGAARAAGAPDTCTPGPNAGRAKATVNAGVSMSTSSSTGVSHLI